MKTNQKRKSRFWIEKIESKKAICVFRENQKRKLRFFDNLKTLDSKNNRVFLFKRIWNLKTSVFLKSNLKTLSFLDFESKNVLSFGIQKVNLNPKTSLFLDLKKNWIQKPLRF